MNESQADALIAQLAELSESVWQLAEACQEHRKVLIALEQLLDARLP
jgi:hypothetical protein